jgi:hypothetical protein
MIVEAHKAKQTSQQVVDTVCLDTEVSVNSQKRAKHDQNRSTMVDLGSISGTGIFSQRVSRVPAPRIEVNPEVKKFKDTVREAEKSTLVFNLNLGKVPVINLDTISTKVTKALTEKAASIDGTGTIPKDDTVAALDDVLSIVKGMKFYGKATKSYNNPKDQLSGSYCTIPVRYDFADKESRLYAESVLRDKCKVQCSTPYPLILRETIKQLVEQTKVKYRGHYVKVSVDTAAMTLRILKRPLLAEGDTSKKIWSTVGNDIPIPDACLDIGARKIPINYKVNIPCDDVTMSGDEADMSDTSEKSDSSEKSEHSTRSKQQGGKYTPKKASSPKKK